MDTHHKPSIKPLEDFLDLYLVKKFPVRMPESLQKFFVQAAPWITLVLLILMVPFFLAFLGISFGFGFGMMGMMGPLGMLAAPVVGFFFIFPLAIFLLEIVALPGLFHAKKTSWNLIFYAQLIGIVMNMFDGRISSLVWSFVGLYVWFQIRSHYK